MDSPVITYLLKASVSIAVFYGVYMLCLRKDTFLRLRRFYFLFAMLVSTAYPLASLQLTTDDIHRLPSFVVSLLGFEEEPVIQQATVELGEMEAGYYAIAEQTEKTPVEASEILLLVIVSVMILLALRFVVQLFSILKLRMNNISEKYGYCRIVKLENRKASPFSFFNWIFVNITGEQQEQQEILAHEEVHARQLHSIDIILTELFCICFWWNPIAWLLRHEVKINLEYLADSGVVREGYNTREYQYLLLQTSNVNTGISIINNFNVSQLKKRIAMMNKKESPVFLSVKYLLMIPIVVGLILSNAVKASPATEIDDKPTANEVFDNEIYSEIFDDNGIVQSFDDKPFNTVEQMPRFPGGESAMMKFITENLKYPVKAVSDNVQGRVVIRFVVSKDGTVKDVSVIRSLSSECDAEAKRVIELMPKWTPGKNKGVAVDVYYTLPIVFKMTEKKETNQKKDAKTEAVDIAELKSNNSDSKPSTHKPFITVEQMPSFPGGEKEMQKFIGNNLKYPVKAQQEGIQGRVTIRFVVDMDGSIKDAQVVRGIDSDLDTEAKRVVETMPKWIPGKQNGTAVPVYFSMPIVFRLSDDKPKVAQNIPEFPGGHEAFLKFMAQNLKYPVESLQKRETAIVNVVAQIKNTGDIVSVSPMENNHARLSNEVVRVIRLMPKWNPAKAGNENETLRYVIPVVFRLKGNSPIPEPEGEIPPNAIVVVGYVD